MTDIAAVVLAHADPVHLRRLVAALDDVPVYLHCDAKTPEPLFRRMTQGLPSRVMVCPRISTNRASWSLVKAELLALRGALTQTSAEHFVVLSGADYPLSTMHELSAELDGWQGRSWLWNVPIPFSPWDTPRHPDGGLWRFKHHFISRRGHVLFARGIPLRWPMQRQVPPGVTLRASSQWKIYARHHVRQLLHVVDTRPDLVRFWRSTLVPEESFAASVLASPSLLGADALPECLTDAWYVHWPGGRADHPDVLRSTDFPKLVALGGASGPCAVVGDRQSTEVAPSYRKFIARKFATDIDVDVLDRIDAELRT